MATSRISSWENLLDLSRNIYSNDCHSNSHLYLYLSLVIEVRLIGRWRADLHRAGPLGTECRPVTWVGTPHVYGFC